MSPVTATLSSRLVWPFVETARSLAAEFERALAQSGLGEELALPAERRIAHETADRLLRLAVAETGRDDLGLLSCGALAPGHFDLLEIALRSQATLGDALGALPDLLPLIHDAGCCVLERRQAEATFALGLTAELPLHPVGWDFGLAAFLLFARRETQLQARAATRVELPYPRPAHARSLEDYFGCTLRFDAERAAVIFPSDWLDAPLLRADATVQACAQRAACELLQARRGDSSFLAKLRAIIADELPRREAKQVARRLHMSERTLRRRIAEEQTTYRSVLNDVRRQLALDYVAQRERSTQAIAELLGFSTAAAFHRAFRSWTGVTVGACRRN